MSGTSYNSKRIARFATILLGGTAVITQVHAADAQKRADGIETVVVTAQHRTQDILSVPYNISAVSGQTIDENHILDTAELMRSVPGVSVVDRGDRNANIVSGIRIRGLNVDSSALGDYAVSAAATVSTYVNDTPIFANFILSPAEIERVEVLKGPQGTLYGSGALGGAVRYITRRPDFDAFSGEVSGTVSSVKDSGSEGLSGTISINIPLTDTLAFRGTVTHNNYPGLTDYVNLYKLDGNGIPVAPNGIASPDAEYYTKKDADFAHQTYAHGTLYWKPTTNFDVTLSYMDQSDKFGGRRGTTLGANGNGVPYKENQSGSVQLEPAARDVYLASLEANYDMGFATLTSSTSDYNNRGTITSENTGFYAQNGWLHDFYYNYPRPMAQALRHYGDKGVIEELRLVSNGDDNTVDYVIGGYYQNQELYSAQDSFLRGFKQWWDLAYCGFFPACEDAVISDQDYLYRHHEHFTDAAIYGDLTWHVNKKFQITGGLRYFDDVSHTHVYQVTALYNLPDSDRISDTYGLSSTSRVLFKGNASWNFDDDNMLYATVAQGYRRGGSNGTPTTGHFAESPAWLTYKPDTDVDYEIGLKGVWNDITYNADLFYVDWKNPQINTATTYWGFFAVQNGKSATTKGFEGQINGALTDRLRYGLGYTYTDSHLGADLYSADGLLFINKKGAQLPGAPKHTINGSLDYTWPMTNASSLLLHLDGYYQSGTQDTIFSASSVTNTVCLKLPSPPCTTGPYFGQSKFYAPMGGFSIFNASTTYLVDNWSATLWVKNIFDDKGTTGIYTQAYMGTYPDQNYYGNASKALNALPRTVGLTVDYKF